MGRRPQKVDRHASLAMTNDGHCDSFRLSLRAQRSSPSHTDPQLTSSAPLHLRHPAAAAGLGVVAVGTDDHGHHGRYRCSRAARGQFVAEEREKVLGHVAGFAEPALGRGAGALDRKSVV